MANRTVPIVGGAVVLALGAALWWTTRDAPDVGVPEDVAAPESSPADVPEPVEATNESDAVPVDESEASADAGPLDEVGEVDSAAGAAATSPFATTGDVGDDAESAATAPAVSEGIAADGAPAPEDSGSGNAGRIVVPRSYPISEAAKYFVPADERGPGNLGGPPPLDFPGGPNDPNREGGGFAPPPPPGQ